jgi:hypothetical protein
VFGADLAYVQLGQSANSNLGNLTTILSPQALQRVTQGGLSASWNGNFTSGDALIYSSNQRYIVFKFKNKVKSVGFQIQSGVLGSFSCGFQVFDSSDCIVGQTTASGTSSTANDGSALFVGINNSNTCIEKVVVRLDPPTPSINRFSINRILLA